MKKTLLYTPAIVAIIIATIFPSTASAAQVNLIISSNASRGTVTGTGINCGSDCTEMVESGSVVAVTATPQSGWLLTYGDGCPSGTSSGPVNCNISAGGGTTATFLWSRASITIVASTTGTGSGTVSGTGTFNYGSSTTLTATPSAGSVFSGWQTNGDICWTGGDKSDGTTVNLSPTCSVSPIGGSSPTLTAVAKFDKSTTSSPSSPSRSPGTTTTPAPSTTTPTKPATPTLEGAVIEGTTQNTTEKIEVSSDKPLVLSGKTVPNGKVALFIFSEPKRYDITADAEGKWTYSISGLPEGDHHAEIEVTDPATNLTSDRAKLLEFTILASTANPVATDGTQKKAPSNLPLILAGVFVILAGAGAAGFFWWKRKRKLTQTFNPFDHTPSQQ